MLGKVKEKCFAALCGGFSKPCPKLTILYDPRLKSILNFCDVLNQMEGYIFSALCDQSL